MSDTATLEAPLATPSPQSPPVGPLADLILVRLLPPGTSRPSPRVIREDLAKFFHRPPTIEQFNEVLSSLRAAGLVSVRGQHLTDAGRTQALGYLGISELPARTNWGTIKSKYLLPRALGVSPELAADSKKLAPLLLKRKLGLPTATPLTLGGVFEAIACQQLGYPDQIKLKDLIPVLLGKVTNADEPIDLKSAEKVVPQVLLGAKRSGTEALRETVLAGWADSMADDLRVSVMDPTPEPEVPFDLEAFANTVQAAARTCPTGRFGDNKVFISHLWRHLADEPRFKPMGLAGFKANLVEANVQRLLNLEPADLNQAFDPVDLTSSATVQFHSTYHFIRFQG